MKKLITLCLVTILHLTLPNYIHCQQPPYQVSIILKMPGNYANPIHLCNGAIINEKLILTTATCMYFKFGINGKSNILDGSDIIVIAGSTTGKTDALQMNVTSIDIAKNFDAITLENDLALLTLSKSLPLESRLDVRWIMIDDNSHINRSCLVNFYMRNTQDAIADYYQTEEVYTINNEICRNFTEFPAFRKRDICSFYVLPHQFNCEKANAFLSFNNDRGTGLVCQNFLVGLLSSVVTRPSPLNNCTDVTLRAIYTNIYPHLRWIYMTISRMETKYISTPYDASVKPLMAIPGISENITSSLNETSVPNTTVSSLSLTNFKVPGNFSSNQNSTRTNSTFSNSTILSHATPHPIAINSTKWNTTSSGNPPRNHTAKPVILTNGVPTASVPGYSPSSDPHLKHPPSSKPAIQNIFKNSGALTKLSLSTVLIVLVYFTLAAFYL